MKEPVIFFNSRSEIVRREISLPSGKQIVIGTSCPEYKTEDPEEIDFLSRLFGVGCRKLSDSEFRLFMTSSYNDLPHVERKNITPEELEAFMASPAHEELIVEKLRAKGYTLEKKSEDFTSGIPEVSKEFTAPKNPTRGKKSGDKK